jgi:hypothetical protein
MWHRCLILALAAAAMAGLTAPASAHTTSVTVVAGIGVDGQNLLPGRTYYGPNVPRRPGGGGRGPTPQRRK